MGFNVPAAATRMSYLGESDLDICFHNFDKPRMGYFESLMISTHSRLFNCGWYYRGSHDVIFGYIYVKYMSF